MPSSRLRRPGGKAEKRRGNEVVQRIRFVTHWFRETSWWRFRMCDAAMRCRKIIGSDVNGLKLSMSRVWWRWLGLELAPLLAVVSKHVRMARSWRRSHNCGGRVWVLLLGLFNLGHWWWSISWFRHARSLGRLERCRRRVGLRPFCWAEVRNIPRREFCQFLQLLFWRDWHGCKALVVRDVTISSFRLGMLHKVHVL